MSWILFSAAALLCVGARGEVNSVGMTLVRIEPGTFQMGESATVPDELIVPLTYPTRDELRKRFPQADPKEFRIRFEDWRHGDFDEWPIHAVRISRAFAIGATEVTNAQYEQFDPAHKARRGKMGFSKDDDEAVVFVSWEDANAFCRWLTQKEGRHYRLPTEAEWEYAARAGAKGLFAVDPVLKNARSAEFRGPADVVPLHVGKSPSNAWGLFDVHGNVEEWTADWYGPYEAGAQTDPAGRADGDFRVTRGGSHGTDAYYLRLANRLGTLPETRSWLIGFRVVQGEPAGTKLLPVVRAVTTPNPAPVAPVPMEGLRFEAPRRYVKIAPDAHGPLYARHNHDAGITEAPNGDLLAIWYTCQQERGRELGVGVSRLRRGAKEWEPAQPFWNAPDRNDHCPAIWYDGRNTLYHFNGLGVAGRWEPLSIVMRTSTDSGYTWSKARLIAPEFGFRNMVGEPVFETKDGALVFGADASGGSTIWVSRDQGRTWNDPGGTIAGIHAGIVERSDGSLFALGRGQDVGGWMPQSVSTDSGKTWQVSASPFPPIGGTQRLALQRLQDGALFLASFAEDPDHPRPIARGQTRRHVSKLFAAVSVDEGKTWPVRKVIAVDGAVETIDSGIVHGAEPLGYLAVTQARDGMIHLISSVNHYAFNVAWLKQAAAPSAIAVHPLPAKGLLSGKSGFAAVDPKVGFTVEARGEEFELDLYAVPGTALTANHYRLVVKTGGVHYFFDGALREIGTASAGVHTWRLAVRPDSIVQIYRDGELVSTQPADFIVDWRQPARGSYFEVKGAVVRFDANGAYR